MSDGKPEPYLVPDDWTHLYKTVRQHLESLKDENFYSWIFAVKEFVEAYKEFQRAAKSVYDQGDDLRHEPFITSDTLDHGNMYVFKADNNGNTYRIKEATTYFWRETNDW